jgi:hypothetical protein
MVLPNPPAIKILIIMSHQDTEKKRKKDEREKEREEGRTEEEDYKLSELNWWDLQVQFVFLAAKEVTQARSYASWFVEKKIRGFWICFFLLKVCACLTTTSSSLHRIYRLPFHFSISYFHFSLLFYSSLFLPRSLFHQAPFLPTREHKNG